MTHHIIIYYCSYLVFPFLGIIGFLFVKKKIKKTWQLIVSIILIIGSILFISTRFVEPQMIVVHEHKYQTGFSVRFALISDPHLGVYKDAKFLQRVVNKINQQDVDFVLIAGDLVYFPHGRTTKLFAPLKDCNVPVYAVLGNHDMGIPGPDLSKEVRDAMSANGVLLLENKYIEVKSGIKLLGLGSKWADNDEIELLNNFEEKDNLIVMMHNPDTLNDFPKNIADFSVAGHSHGGQIKLPFVYKSVLPTENKMDEGFYQQNGNKIFVTSGIGEIGLPMRFLNPPTIDIIELY